MFGLSRIGHVVALGRVDHQVKLFVGFLPFVNEMCRILHIDVLVNHPVDQQQPVLSKRYDRKRKKYNHEPRDFFHMFNDQPREDFVESYSKRYVLIKLENRTRMNADQADFH